MTAQIIYFPIERVPEAQARPTVEESRAYLDKLIEELKAARSEKKELERRIRSLTMRARQAIERLKRERLTKSRKSISTRETPVASRAVCEELRPLL